MTRCLIAIGSALALAACAGSAPEPDDTGAPATAALAELAPTGRLRVAIAVAPAASTFFSMRDQATGELRGVAVTLGAELASQLRVPVEYVVYPNSGELAAAGALGAWDVSFLPADEERAAIVDFGPAYNLFESTYLVRAGSAIESIAEVDRPGVRVAAVDNTTTGRSAARQLESATLRSFRSVDEVQQALLAGEVDAAAMSRASLQALLPNLPGARVLPGHFHATANTIAVPKGRAAALAYATRFIEDAKASGRVRRAFDAIGLTDAVVAPPAPAQ
jgi:polar amino acid transport system substrate-binding protein